MGELEQSHWNEERARFGHLLESLVLQPLIALADGMPRPPRSFHYRDRDKTEVDLEIESRRNIWEL